MITKSFARSVVRVASLLSVAALAGCAVAPQGEEGSEGRVESAMAIGRLPPDPLTLCTSIPADESLSYVNGNFTMGGTSDASRACDFDVLEVTGTLGKPLQMGLTDLEPNQSHALPPQGIANAAACAESYVDYETMGLQPPEWTLVNGLVVYTAGKWIAVNSHVTYGTWSGTSCAFAGMNGAFPTASWQLFGGTAGYERVRVAVKAVVERAAGAERAPMYLYVGP